MEVVDINKLINTICITVSFVAFLFFTYKVYENDP